jgi:LysM repeat protein
METRPGSPLRLLAPAALIVFVIAGLLILVSAGGSGGSKSDRSATKAERRDLGLKGRQAASGGSRLPRGVYVVRTGDTLEGIAQKTGVTVERLQELNPNLDPQALVSGQRLKLR